MTAQQLYDPYRLIAEVRELLRRRSLSPHCPPERAGMCVGAAGQLLRALGIAATDDVADDPDDDGQRRYKPWQTYDPNHLIQDVRALLRARGLSPDYGRDLGGWRVAYAGKLLRSLGIVPAMAMEDGLDLPRVREDW